SIVQLSIELLGDGIQAIRSIEMNFSDLVRFLVDHGLVGHGSSVSTSDKMVGGTTTRKVEQKERSGGLFHFDPQMRNELLLTLKRTQGFITQFPGDQVDQCFTKHDV